MAAPYPNMTPEEARKALPRAQELTPWCIDQLDRAMRAKSAGMAGQDQHEHACACMEYQLRHVDRLIATAAQSSNGDDPKSGERNE